MANKPNRSRGRGRKPGNNTNRSYESNGPDVKIRGNAAHISEKYQQLARDASVSGDRVGAENYLQHAEHYYRLVLASQQQNQEREQQQQRSNSESGDADNQFDSQNNAGDDNNGGNNDAGERGERAVRSERNDNGGDADGNREGTSRRRTRRRRDTVKENTGGQPSENQSDDSDGNRDAAPVEVAEKKAKPAVSEGPADTGDTAGNDDTLVETA